MQGKIEDSLEMDAALFTALSKEGLDPVFKYVLSTPMACPACGELWALLLNKPLILEVELGKVGTQHMALIEKAIVEQCTQEASVTHLRTDGETVWTPEQACETASH